MRRFIAISFAASILAPAVAVAEVSADLVFCSKLANPRERIACYDAAARIAARTITNPVRVSAPRPMVTQEVADRAMPVHDEPKGRFNGAFATIGATYGTSSGRSVLVTGIGSALQDTVNPNGWSGAASVGYNATIGRFLMGVELSGRWGNESAAITRITATPLVPLSFTSGTQLQSFEIKSDASVHLAARFGATFDDTMVFAKFGVGASHIAETATLDATRMVACTFLAAGCALTVRSHTAWTPSVLIGGGIEQNFGAFFARAQGEVEIASLQPITFSLVGNATSDLFWTARAMAAIGVRF